MLAVLAAQWGLLLFRGVVALFGAYALIDGGVALIVAFSALTLRLRHVAQEIRIA